jgi:hypothetical protein
MRRFDDDSLVAVLSVTGDYGVRKLGSDELEEQL